MRAKGAALMLAGAGGAMLAGAGGAMRATGRRRDSHAGFHPHAFPVRAKGAALMLAGAGGAMLAGAGGAMRATGRRATAIRFHSQAALPISLTRLRARGADDGGRRRRDASYGVARDSHPVSTIR